MHKKTEATEDAGCIAGATGTHWWRSAGPGWLHTSRWLWRCLSCRLGRTAARPCYPGCRCSSLPWPCVTAERHLSQSCDKPQTQFHYGPCGAAASPPERPAAAGKKWEVPPSCYSPYLLSYSSPRGDSRYRKQKKESYALGSSTLFWGWRGRN